MSVVKMLKILNIRQVFMFHPYVNLQVYKNPRHIYHKWKKSWGWYIEKRVNGLNDRRSFTKSSLTSWTSYSAYSFHLYLNLFITKLIFTLRWIHYENLNKPHVDLFCKPFPNKLLGSYDNVCGINTWRVLKLSLLSSTLWHGQSRFEYHSFCKKKRVFVW